MTTLRDIYHTVAGLAEHGRRLAPGDLAAWQALAGQFQELADQEGGYCHAEHAPCRLRRPGVGASRPAREHGHAGDVASGSLADWVVDRVRRPRGNRSCSGGTAGGCHCARAPGQPPGPGSRRWDTPEAAGAPAYAPACQRRLGGPSHRQRALEDRSRPLVPNDDQQRGRVDVPCRWPAVPVAAGRPRVPGAHRPTARPQRPRCWPAGRGPGASRPGAEPRPVAYHDDGSCAVTIPYVRVVSFIR